MKKVRLLVALSAAVLTIGVASRAQAQTRLPKKAKEVPAAARASKGTAGAGEPAKTTGEPAKADRTTGGRKVVRLEEMRVEGRVQKPQALFLMPRASVTTGDQDRSESFLSKTTDAVKKDPF
jgi:hypothetical protein